MKTLMEPDTTADSQLVELCLRGNRNAFAQIVTRYQSIISAIAYNACGDIGRSEDIAQDTFITAWQSLAQLHEPEKLKSWLCGIARNLTNNSVRQQQRVPTAAAGPLPQEKSSGAATPSDEAISREEELLMWRTLEAIPETYREPMILFYREHQSAQAVADTLDISEDAVRQRLARGRAMLTERVAKTVESALIKSAPGRAFTLAVLEALPATISAKAVAIGAAAAKGGAAAKAAGFAGMFGSFLGAVMCFVGPWIGYRVEMDDSRSPEARRFVQQFFRILVAGMVLFMVAMLAVGKFGGSLAHSHPALYAGLWIGSAIAYIIFVIALQVWARPPTHDRSARTAALTPLFEYRSKFSMLGLPLIHIRIRGGRPVKAWFAAGDSAFGVIFAFGGLAVAPLSFGGVGVGLLTIGGFAIGLVPFGGFSFGPWAVGAFAIGWQASGVWAAGWSAADGGLMGIAHDFARGSVALAANANDPAAKSFFKTSRFFNAVQIGLRYVNWLSVIYLFPLVLWWRIRRNNRSSKQAL